MTIRFSDTFLNEFTPPVEQIVEPSRTRGWHEQYECGKGMQSTKRHRKGVRARYNRHTQSAYASDSECTIKAMLAGLRDLYHFSSRITMKGKECLQSQHEDKEGLRLEGSQSVSVAQVCEPIFLDLSSESSLLLSSPLSLYLSMSGGRTVGRQLCPAAPGGE